MYSNNKCTSNQISKLANPYLIQEKAMHVGKLIAPTKPKHKKQHHIPLNHCSTTVKHVIFSCWQTYGLLCLPERKIKSTWLSTFVFILAALH